VLLIVSATAGLLIVLSSLERAAGVPAATGSAVFYGRAINSLTG
jgi:hypothetical protein